MTEHTPGPWVKKYYKGAEEKTGTWGVRSRLFSICNMVSNLGEDEANAHLIAAAPDLLEALENTTMTLEAICTPESMAEIYAKEARALIRKVRDG